MKIFSALKNIVKTSTNTLGHMSSFGRELAAMSTLGNQLKEVEKKIDEYEFSESLKLQIIQGEISEQNKRYFSPYLELIRLKIELESAYRKQEEIVFDSQQVGNNNFQNQVEQIKNDLDYDKLSNKFLNNADSILNYLARQLGHYHDEYSGKKFHYSTAVQDSRALSEEYHTQIGDSFELFLGRHYEKTGSPVIYNGIIKRKQDRGVDLIIFSDINTAIYVQVKNWYQKEFNIEELDAVYNKICTLPFSYSNAEFKTMYLLSAVDKRAEPNFEHLVDKLPSINIEKMLYLPSKNNVTNEVDKIFKSGEYKGMKLKYHNQKHVNFFGASYK
jgi:hypothetical protein